MDLINKWLKENIYHEPPAKTTESIQAENKELKILLKEALDLYFDFSNKNDFDEWVEKTKEILKENVNLFKKERH